METVQETQKPELVGHVGRARELASRLTADQLTLDLCNDFDAAVEFAACEGRSVAQAIAEFFEEQGGPALIELKKLTVPAVSLPAPKLPV